VLHHRFHSVAAVFLAILLFSAESRSDAAGVTFDTVISDGEDHAFLSYGGDSRTLVQGGEISHLTFTENAYGEITGGDQSFVNLRNFASALIAGGVRSHTLVYDSAYVEVSGGEFSSLTTNDTSQANVVGGDFGSITARDSSKITIGLGDASIGILRPRDGGVVDLLGGVVSTINPLQDGTTNIYGGTVLNRILLNPSTVTNVFVKNYQLDLISELSENPIYDLTGVLADGSSINVNVTLPAGAELNFIVVPEPTHFGMLALATFCFPWLLRRKHPTKNSV